MFVHVVVIRSHFICDLTLTLDSIFNLPDGIDCTYLTCSWLLTYAFPPGVVVGMSIGNVAAKAMGFEGEAIDKTMLIVGIPSGAMGCATALGAFSNEDFHIGDDGPLDQKRTDL